MNSFDHDRTAPWGSTFALELFDHDAGPSAPEVEDRDGRRPLDGECGTPGIHEQHLRSVVQGSLLDEWKVGFRERDNPNMLPEEVVQILASVRKVPPRIDLL